MRKRERRGLPGAGEVCAGDDLAAYTRCHGARHHGVTVGGEAVVGKIRADID